MVSHEDPSAAVYRLLEDVLASGTASPGSRGALYALIDEFRSNGHFGDHLDQAERISIELHKLEWARQHVETDKFSAAQRELKKIACEWLNTRISGVPLMAIKSPGRRVSCASW